MSTTPVLLFDLDGTLLDTAPEFAQCLNFLLAQEGRAPVSIENIRHLISFGAKFLVAEGFGLPIQHPCVDRLNARFLDIYRQNIGFKTEYFPGILSLLEKLTQEGIAWGIVTNKPARFTHPLLEKFELLHTARSIVCGDTLATSKPDPAPLLHACRQLGVSPLNGWYIGDAKTDVEAGRQAGMQCAIANYGYIPFNQNSRDWKADYYFHHADELKRLVFD